MYCDRCGGDAEHMNCPHGMTEPYMHDANATKEDPTPGGPMTTALRMHPDYPGSIAELSVGGDELFRPGCIRTVSGRFINIADPDPESFHIEDIANSLSWLPRFGGHLRHGYMVAQHCVLASLIVEEENAFAALMHDATEGYLIDVPSPVKDELGGYKVLEDRFHQRMAPHFGYRWPFHSQVKEADAALLCAEFRRCMLGDLSVRITPWSHKVAYWRFFARYNELKP